MKSVFKLGTRRSLLAWAQSSWVAKEVQRLNPGIHVELVGIDTRGDQIQNIPLHKAEGKDFFVAELDLALKNGSVDFTVHSMKDLSLTRPSEFVCAAIPKRENPRDVILFGPHTIQRLADGKALRIGSSSPRRMENIPHFLEKALPQISNTGKPRIEWVEIRGNVNTRLSRVHEALQSEKYLDGVVLAFAGLIRLWADPKGKLELQKLLLGTRWMVLPLKQCPAAPAQGALAVECRAADPEVKECLGRLHSADTTSQVAQERALLAEWGGGCHQKFGATAWEHPELGRLLFVRGVRPDGVFVEDLSWNRSPNALVRKQESHHTSVQAWDGSLWRAQSGRTAHPTIENETLLKNLKQTTQAVFVAHSRAWPQKEDPALPGRTLEGNLRIWTSGVSSWFKLAEKGVWVEGCAEGFGFSDLIPTLEQTVLELPSLPNWVVLTHQDGLDEWNELGMRAEPTYKINSNYGDDAKSALRKATHVFWSSGSQFDELKENLPKEIHQACGPGKTAAKLRRGGVNPLVFPSVEEWRKWLKIQD